MPQILLLITESNDLKYSIIFSRGFVTDVLEQFLKYSAKTRILGIARYIIH